MTTMSPEALTPTQQFRQQIEKDLAEAGIEVVSRRARWTRDGLLVASTAIVTSLANPAVAAAITR